MQPLPGAKRPSLSIIRSILFFIQASPKSEVRWSEFHSLRNLRNAKRLGEYLKLLLALHWIERIEKRESTPYDPTKETRSRTWRVVKYRLTSIGMTLLELLPPDMDDDKNSVYSLVKRPNLYILKDILEKCGDAPWSYTDLLEIDTAKNRVALRRYLNLLCSLGFLKETEDQTVSSLLTGRYTFRRMYETTKWGKAFLELFPKVDEHEEVVELGGEDFAPREELTVDDVREDDC